MSGTTYRITVSSMLGSPVMLDVDLRHVGPNPRPVVGAKYWTFQVKNHLLYYLLDSSQGTIYDVRALNAFLGYDVTDAVKGGASELRTFQNLHHKEITAAEQAAYMEQIGKPQAPQQPAPSMQQQPQPVGARPPAARGRSTQPPRRY